MTDSKSVQAEPAGDPQREAMRAAAKRIDRINNWLRIGGALSPDEYKRFQDAGLPMSSTCGQLTWLHAVRRHVSGTQLERPG